LVQRRKNPEFWKEVATAFMKEKHNTETSRNGYPITIYQRGPPMNHTSSPLIIEDKSLSVLTRK